MNPTGTPQTKASLIELLIVMSIMLILMALIVPQVSRIKKTANQTSAVQSMPAIGQGEIGFNSAYPTAGYACTLQPLGGDPKSGALSPQAAQLGRSFGSETHTWAWPVRDGGLACFQVWDQGEFLRIRQVS